MSAAIRYRKKPVVVEAMRLTERDARDVAAWCDGQVRILVEQKFGGDTREFITGLEIVTLEGVMTANLGDYVIRGVQGEFYPCKREIFEATYELAEEASA